jgi:AraC-like DNA-binding protein
MRSGHLQDYDLSGDWLNFTFEGKQISDKLVFLCKHTWASHHILLPHVHRGYEFIFVLAGEGSIFSQGIDYSLSSGDILVMEPNTEHQGTANPDNPFDLFTMCYDFSRDMKHFDPELASLDTLLLRLYRAYTSKTRPPIIQDKHDMANVIYKLAEEISDEKICRNKLIRAYIFQIFALLIRNLADFVEKVEVNQGEVELAEAVENTIEFIQANYDKNLTLEDISSNVCLSASHFCRLFRHATSLTPMDYLNSTRIANAKKMLLYSNFTLSEIAYRVGYNSIHYFSRRFKETEGIPPSVYRETMKTDV